jgi:hypothetical protein
MRANTSGSWRSSQRSLAATSCWLMPLPVRRTNSAEQPVCAVEQHHRRQHASHADRGDVPALPPGALQKFLGHGAGVPPPLLRILLGPARVVGMKVGRARGERERAAVGVDQDTNRRGRADVDPDGQRHRFSAAP